jgi:hypothetical protein
LVHDSKSSSWFWTKLTDFVLATFASHRQYLFVNGILVKKLDVTVKKHPLSNLSATSKKSTRTVLNRSSATLKDSISTVLDKTDCEIAVS